VTLALAGCCARTGMLGAIVMSSSPAVASRCARARSRVGAACSQNVTVDAFGRAASFSGKQTLGTHADCTGEDCAAAGNLLADKAAPEAMAAAFGADPAADLGDRLMAALRAGRDAGGEEGDVHSAGMIVVDSVTWPVTDLRIDWTDADPVEELASLWLRWQPLAADYVNRALEPSLAPSYGVPGDE
jgi:uncharacterized Ntn-hydrolase superfamily protein